MSKGEVRVVLTILMYAGVAVFFAPYFFGRVFGLSALQVGGVVAAVVFGMARCLWSEEECWRHVR